MSAVEICAVIDRVGASIAPARALGRGPYVVVADVTDAPVEARLASRLALLRSLRDVACLPFRFGSILPDDAAALTWLEERREAIEGALARAASRCEFDLHRAVSRESAPPRGDGPGARHLRALASRYGGLGEEDSRRALETCRGLPGVEETVVAAEDGFIAFLVSDAGAFARAARALPLSGARWSGPWPAFTFAARWIA
jgi:hypothetical protein